MASNKWTPVYEYKRTFMENVYMCFLFLLAYFILCGGIILITSINNIIAGSILGIFAICLFVLSYLEYTLPNRTKINGVIKELNILIEVLFLGIFL